MTLGYRPTWTDPYRFIFSPDKHVGWENAGGGRKRELHHLKALTAMFEFARDFKPHGWIEGGDQLDLGAISHWNANKKLSVEGLRLHKDIEEYEQEVLGPIDELNPVDKVWMIGNHEGWVDELVDLHPALEQTLNLDNQLGLSENGWRVVPQGGMVELGKLTFIHGDTIKGGGENVAKTAVVNYESSIRMGHFHTHLVYTKHNPVDSDTVRTGVVVPGMTHRNHRYSRSAPNKHLVGFNYGYIFPDGTFSDDTVIVTGGRFARNGRVYQG